MRLVVEELDMKKATSTAQENIVLTAQEKFNKINLKSNPFNKDELKTYQLHLFVGRKKEIENILSILGENKNIHIYGKKGIGKSSLLNYLSEEIKKENITIAPIKAPPLTKRQLYISIIKSLINNNDIEENSDMERYATKLDKYSTAPAIYPSRVILEDLKFFYEKFFKKVDFPVVVIIDNFDNIFRLTGVNGIDYITELTNIMYERYPFVFITAGLIGGIKDQYLEPIKQALEERLDAKFALRDLTLDETQKLIEKRLLDEKLPNTEGFSFTEETIKTIHEKSETPRETVDICDGLLRFSLSGNSITSNVIDNVTASLGLTQEQKVKAALREKPQRVYNKLLELDKACSPIELSRYLNMNPNTVIYNLKILIDNELVKKIGKSTRTTYKVDVGEGIKDAIKQQAIVTDMSGRKDLIFGFSDGKQEKPSEIEADPQTVIMDGKPVKEAIKKSSQKESKS